MRKLRKSNAKSFGKMCDRIREALHLEHWENRYTLEEKDEEKPELLAQHCSYLEGRRLWIRIYPGFWELSAEHQLSTLIHEHVHGIMQTQDQIIGRIIHWTHEADRRWSEKAWLQANEHVVDHLTSVLFDLLQQ